MYRTILQGEFEIYKGIGIMCVCLWCSRHQKKNHHFIESPYMYLQSYYKPYDHQIIGKNFKPNSNVLV